MKAATERQVPSSSRGRIGWGWVENAGKIYPILTLPTLLEGEGTGAVLIISVYDTVRLRMPQKCSYLQSCAWALSTLVSPELVKQIIYSLKDFY
jgi:hypothetical protein